MPAPKKYTQFIFDDIYRNQDPEDYGYLGLMYEVVNEIIKIRKQNNISQQKLAEQSGLTQPTIARLEAGRSNPTLSQLIKISKALNQRIRFEPAKYSTDQYFDFTDKD